MLGAAESESPVTQIRPLESNLKPLIVEFWISRGTHQSGESHVVIDFLGWDVAESDVEDN